MLTILAVGAKNKTQDEIIQALHLWPDVTYPSHRRNHPRKKGSIQPLSDGYRCLLPQLESNDFPLSVANGIFLHRGFNPKVEFLDATIKHFHSEVMQTDFEEPKNSAREINSWVAEKTKDKMKEFIKPGSLSELTKILLVIALYFKANWANGFDRNLSHPGQFFIRKETKYMKGEKLKLRVKKGEKKEREKRERT